MAGAGARAQLVKAAMMAHEVFAPVSLRKEYRMGRMG